tara:strand:- start:3148 stop:3741 length:594 start_codon:yes stop_codon:yes gene_type:complete
VVQEEQQEEHNMAELDSIIKQAQEIDQAKKQPTAMPMQYEEPTINPFNAPIPGQGLTDEPGNYPWEHPPQFTQIEDAADFLYERLSNPKQLKRLLTMMRIGIPIEALVKVITFSGFLEGKFTVDVARLLEPIVAMQIMSKAQVAEIPAKINLGDAEDTEFYKDMAKVKKSIDLDNLPMEKMTEKKIEEQSVKGLMEK